MSTWNHLSADEIATNIDPVFGGIVDKAIVSGKWFVIPNSDHIAVMEDFDTKAEAIAALNAAVADTYELN